MNTPHYIIHKVGDQFIPVRQEPYPWATRTAYLGWSSLLLYLGMHRRGVLRTALWAGALGLVLRGTCSSRWLASLRLSFKRRACHGKPSEAPSYQNDFAGRTSQLPADLIDEQVMESFPASDPPGRSRIAHS